MPIIIPIWFYEFGSVMYFFAAIIGLLLTYFSFKLYDYTRRRSHLFLLLSFIFITLGFIILTISNTYSHFHFEQCNPNCTITRQEIFTRIVLGNYLYYAASIIGYSLFLLSYSMDERKFEKRGKSVRKLSLGMIPALAISIFFQSQPLMALPPGFPPLFEPIFVLYPFESRFFQPFQIISSIILLLIVIKTYSNYKKTKTDLSMLVPAGFAAILLYHILMFSIPYSPLFFAFAHLSLLVGFSLLLYMLAKVTRK